MQAMHPQADVLYCANQDSDCIVAFKVRRHFNRFRLVFYNRSRLVFVPRRIACSLATRHVNHGRHRF
jgi:6-phosphogluconolactonase (cycloisomerase 2 family)